MGGVVRSSKGPEAGVWVIAETKDLPTPYAKIVVTDDQGRYLLPDLPKANYSVFVRGYGLVDSPRVNATPGKALNLTAVIAPNDHAAAQYYPAGYWLSMLRIPEAGEFPGTGPQGNGINPNVKSQAEWMRLIKSGSCTAQGARVVALRRLDRSREPRRGAACSAAPDRYRAERRLHDVGLGGSEELPARRRLHRSP